MAEQQRLPRLLIQGSPVFVTPTPALLLLLVPAGPGCPKWPETGVNVCAL